MTRSWPRGTMASTNPCSSSRSALWKPSGSSSPTVPLATRAPAKPMSAPGSARITSPSEANEASTPPVVGSVRMLMNGTPASFRRPRAAVVLASWSREIVPSCIRAPPEALTITAGTRSANAPSKQRATFSPTTLPIEPPMNRKSNRPMATGWPSTRPMPQMAASASPDLARDDSMRSGYGLLSTNPSGSPLMSPASRSSNELASRSSPIRSGAERRKWWPQVGHTRWLRSSWRLNSWFSQRGHLVHVSAGADRRENGNLIFMAAGAPSATPRPPRSRC